MKISKKLISSVLNIPLESITDVYIDGNYLLIRKTNNRIEECNIYGFAFKCKEWAINKNYSLMTRQAREYDLCSPSIYKQVGLCNVLVNDNPNVSKGIFLGNTEVEAIIEACNWVLKET